MVARRPGGAAVRTSCSGSRWEHGPGVVGAAWAGRGSSNRLTTHAAAAQRPRLAREAGRRCAGAGRWHRGRARVPHQRRREANSHDRPRAVRGGHGRWTLRAAGTGAGAQAATPAADRRRGAGGPPRADRNATTRRSTRSFLDTDRARTLAKAADAALGRGEIWAHSTASR